jgi:hypothetical protein
VAQHPIVEQELILIQAMLTGVDVPFFSLKRSLVNTCQNVRQGVMLDHLILLKLIKCLVFLHLGLREDLNQILNSVMLMIVGIAVFQAIPPTADNKVMGKTLDTTVITLHPMEIPIPMEGHQEILKQKECLCQKD